MLAESRPKSQEAIRAILAKEGLVEAIAECKEDIPFDHFRAEQLPSALHLPGGDVYVHV